MNEKRHCHRHRHFFGDTVLKAIKQMKNKKSSSRDEITQEQMIMGAEVLAIPLTRIIDRGINIYHLFMTLLL